MATKRTNRETKEKKKQASPPFRLPGASSQKTKNKIKIWGKTWLNLLVDDRECDNITKL
jgi:hypothetical protein